jgi:hypothetical protein
LFWCEAFASEQGRFPYAVAFLSAYAEQPIIDYANLKIQQEKFKSQIVCIADKQIRIPEYPPSLETPEIKPLLNPSDKGHV